MAVNLTSVSTFGWYNDQEIVESLTPVSTFGWYFDLSDIVANPDIIQFLLSLNRTLELTLER